MDWKIKMLQTFMDNKDRSTNRCWEMVIPRREGKTTLLKAIAKECESYDTYSCTTSERNHQTLGFPAFDVDNTHVSSNTLLFIDDYDHCSQEWEVMQTKVLEAGGLVIRTKSSKNETKEKRCIKIIL